MRVGKIRNNIEKAATEALEKGRITPKCKENESKDKQLL